MKAMDLHIYPSKDNKFRATHCNNSISLYVNISRELLVNDLRTDHNYDRYNIVIHNTDGSIDNIIPAVDNGETN